MFFFSCSSLQEYPSRKLRLIEDSNASMFYNIPPCSTHSINASITSSCFYPSIPLTHRCWCFFLSSFVIWSICFFCCFLCQKRLNWCGGSFFMVSSNSWSSSIIIIVNYSRRQCHLTHKICYCCSYGRDGQKIPFRLAIKIKFNLCFRFIVAASFLGVCVCVGHSQMAREGTDSISNRIATTEAKLHKFGITFSFHLENWQTSSIRILCA